jgi:hypothetical protein
MKKLLLMLFFVNLGCLAYSQQTADNSKNQPVITFKETAWDFGTISQTAGKVSHSFEVTNTGKEVLLISNVQGSCGCTVTEWSKEPIVPGSKGYVKVAYDPTNRPGAFNKTITVTNNSASSPVYLTVKGSVSNP